MAYRGAYVVPKLIQADNRRPKKSWWLVGMVLFMLFLLLQMPATWVIKKVAPNNSYIQHVSGNLWQGALIWQLPMGASSLSGSGAWSWRPLSLLFGKMGANVEVNTGQSTLVGKVNVGQNSWQIDDFNGKITPETLASLVNWQLPNAAIDVKDVRIDHQAKKGEKVGGFTKADGQLLWAGGEMGYPSGGRVFHLMMPKVYASLSAEQKNNTNLLHLSLNNQQDKRLGDLYLDDNMMLDVNLTQRLLETMPDYKGQAPKDTPVVSVRQPLFANLGGAQ